MIKASKVALVVKNLPANAGDMRHRFDSWVRKIPWKRKWPPTPVFLRRKSQGQRSLAGYSPCSDSVTEHACISFSIYKLETRTTNGIV